MELNKEHREALMSELKKAKEQLRLNKQGREIHDSENVSHWFDISIFLIAERISLIEKSLIENKIDY